MSWTDAFGSIEELPPLGSVEIDRADTEAFDRAYQEGYEAGLAEGRARGEALGRAEATEQVQHEAHLALDAVVAAAGELRRRDAIGLDSVQAFAVDLGLGLAETIIGREIDAAIDPGRDAIVRALAVAPTNGTVVARLHPEDLAALGGVDQLVGDRELRLVADPSVGRGGCLLDVGPSRVNATVAEAIDRARAELTGATLAGSAPADATGLDPEHSDLGGGA